MAIELVHPGFELIALALQVGDLLLGQFFPLGFDGSGVLDPVLLDMFPFLGARLQRGCPFVDILCDLFLRVSVDLLNLGFEVFASALQIGDLFLGNLSHFALTVAAKVFQFCSR